MTNEQPEALRLANELDNRVVPRFVYSTGGSPRISGCKQDSECALAAAELRRLHEAHEWQYTMAGERLRRIEKLETTNNEMLSALKRIKETGVFLGAIAQEIMDSAIKKAEGTE